MDSTAGYSAPSTPTLKPDVSSSFINASRQFKNFGWALLLVTVVYMAIGFIAEIPALRMSLSGQTPPSIDYFTWFVPYIVLILVIFCILFYGYILASLKAARGEKPSITDLFRPFTRFFPVIFSGILLYIIMVLGFLLLIIPGIFFMCRLIFVPYLIVDRKAGVFEAIAGSWKLTRGHFWTIFLIGLIIVVAESVIMGIICAIFIPVMFIGGIGLASPGEVPNMWPLMIDMAIVLIPFMMYMMLLWGSMFNAVQFEKADRNPINPVSPTPPVAQ